MAHELHVYNKNVLYHNYNEYRYYNSYHSKQIVFCKIDVQNFC